MIIDTFRYKDMFLQKYMQKHDLPEWYKGYEFVLSNYRPPSTPWKSFLSIFQWHNETLNIHTHLLAGIYFLYTYLNDTSHATNEVYYCYTLGNIGPIIMGFASASAHTFQIVDAKWNTFVWRIDFVGIVAVNLSHQLLDTLLFFRMVFPGSLFLRYVMALETLFALRCIWQIIRGDGHHWGVLYPLITCIPLTGMNMILASYQKNIDLYTACYSSFLCSVYICIAGGIFFMGKFPERFWVGKFDTFSSHTWHHIFIVASIFAAKRALLRL